MGLDMYLTKRRRGSEDDRELVAYWRKANQIHGWFERNTCDGYIENCECYPVCIGDLECLMADCRLVMEKPGCAPQVLPTTEGFFFGGASYDDCYFENVQATIEQIGRVIADAAEDDELFYHAWW